MTNSFLIGKAIYKILTQNQSLAQYIGDKIFPVIAEQGTTFPYIAFSQTAVMPAYTKDGNYQDESVVEFVIASTDYLEMSMIANELRKALECRAYRDDDINILDCTIQMVSEAYDDNAQAFIKRISFSFDIS